MRSIRAPRGRNDSNDWYWPCLAVGLRLVLVARQPEVSVQLLESEQALGLVKIATTDVA